jgi:hypothetical protein
VGVFSAIVLLPLAPVRGVVALADLIQRQVDQEMRDPATTRRQLERIEEARKRGELSEEEEEQAQEQILQSRITPRDAQTTPAEDG